jgi:hypothetical protein
LVQVRRADERITIERLDHRSLDVLGGVKEAIGGQVLT